VKTYLSSRVETVNKLKKMATEKRNTLTQKVKALQKAENLPMAKCIVKVGEQDSWLARLEKQAVRIKMLQKNF